MPRTLSLALLAVLLVAAAGLAGEKKKAPANKLTGTWTRTVGGTTITFDIKAKDLTITVKAGEGSVIIHADYGVTKDNVVFGIITKVEKKGLEPEAAEKGALFSIVFSVKKREATASDLKGTKVDDEARKTMEGVYTRK
jgi:hypothetical protein